MILTTKFADSFYDLVFDIIDLSRFVGRILVFEPFMLQSFIYCDPVLRIYTQEPRNEIFAFIRNLSESPEIKVPFALYNLVK